MRSPEKGLGIGRKWYRNRFLKHDSSECSASGQDVGRGTAGSQGASQLREAGQLVLDHWGQTVSDPGAERNPVSETTEKGHGQSQSPFRALSVPCSPSPLTVAARL
ncbi:Hypothetical predicted protein [Marmota monax]|uniref:Uncharacterized protein n=1 Tax=Marmota monax TaxID=9995 RepID=A0A5E4AEN7_MARMO|nr:Hypothetical predicted protein [Marmota monax]